MLAALECFQPLHACTHWSEFLHDLWYAFVNHCSLVAPSSSGCSVCPDQTTCKKAVVGFDRPNFGSDRDKTFREMFAFPMPFDINRIVTCGSDVCLHNTRVCLSCFFTAFHSATCSICVSNILFSPWQGSTTLAKSFGRLHLVKGFAADLWQLASWNWGRGNLTQFVGQKTCKETWKRCWKMLHMWSLNIRTIVYHAMLFAWFVTPIVFSKSERVGRLPIGFRVCAWLITPTKPMRYLKWR